MNSISKIDYIKQSRDFLSRTNDKNATKILDLIDKGSINLISPQEAITIIATIDRLKKFDSDPVVIISDEEELEGNEERFEIRKESFNIIDDKENLLFLQNELKQRIMNLRENNGNYFCLFIVRKIF